MLWKKKNTLVFVSSALVAASATMPIVSISNLSTSNNKELNNKAQEVVKEFEKNNFNSINGIIGADRNDESPILVESTGPIVSYGSVIYGLDWYAGKRWEINLMDSQYKDKFPGDLNDNFGTDNDFPKRAFVNWTIDVQNHHLWILSNSQKIGDRIYPQTILKFDSLEGKFITSYDMPIDTGFQSEGKNDGKISRTRLYAQISVLKNGNVLIYSLGDWYRTQLLDVQTGEFKINNSLTQNQRIIDFIKKHAQKYDSNNKDVPGTIRLFNLIPIGDGVNIAVLGSILWGNGDNNHNATGDLYLALVDDDFNSIQVSDTNSPWHFNSDNSTGLVVVQNPYRNGNTIEEKWKYNDYVSAFSKSYYYTIDGNVVVSMFSKLFVFKKPSNSEKDSYGVKFASYDFGKEQEISSFTMDVNGNIFYKLKKDTKIYKMIINVASNFEDTRFSVDTYYDISSNNDTEITKNAENFILYNVKGYSGSIMLINTNNTIDKTLSDNQANTNPDQTTRWGLALAITPNKSDQQKGDSLGLLNSEKSILKTADFEIDANVLNSKIPSEITREDINIKNDAFFTRNTEKNNDGTLKYPPFKLENINDSEGTFDVVVNLDQIPWFASTLPSDAKPKTIVKKFDGKTIDNTKNGIAQKIETKVSWKKETELSYDFKNTIPSKITNKDLNDFDPFKISFSSRTVLNSDGSVAYPKKTYSIGQKDDANGTIEVIVSYEYMPLSSEVNTPLTYTSKQSYKVFSSTSNRQFYFAGATQQASETINNKIDVKDVPQLKYLSESNVLPSSFANANKATLESFINTNLSAGFPLSKMNLQVTPNDETGELTIRAEMPTDYYNQRYVFVQTYTGLNKKSSYNFNFIEKNTISGVNFKNILPSSVNEGDIINDLILYNGFNSSDFSVLLFPNNENGSLNVQIKLNENYPKEFAESLGFKNYSIQKTYFGFMNSNDFNNQYNISFRDNSDKELIDIKKMTLNEINEALTSGKLEIAGKTYSSLNDLIENIFIKEMGVKIPKGWKDKTNQITSKMSFNNESGSMNLSITISKELLNGYGSDLNFVYSYNGFAKGNINPTSDSLSFYSQELFKSIEDLKDVTSAKQLQDILNKDKKQIKILLMGCTGQYVQLIESGDFTLETEVNESYNTIYIKITFTSNLTNSQSLTSYSTQYQF